jgi:hypothetical protein
MYDDHLDESRVTPGVLDGSALNLFSQGGCIALAIALHDATGWPILAVTDGHNSMDGELCGGSSMHWGVRTPEGLFLDVDGVHEFDDLERRYGPEADDEEAAVAQGTRADAAEWHAESAAGKVSVRLAATFVDTVLAVRGAAPYPGR